MEVNFSVVVKLFAFSIKLGQAFNASVIFCIIRQVCGRQLSQCSSRWSRARGTLRVKRVIEVPFKLHIDHDDNYVASCKKQLSYSSKFYVPIFRVREKLTRKKQQLCLFEGMVYFLHVDISRNF